MRKLLLLLPLLFVPSAKASAPVIVQAKECLSNGTSTIACAFGSNNTAGNAIVATASAAGGTFCGVGITGDSHSNSYSVAANFNGTGLFANPQTVVFLAGNILAGANTVTLTAASCQLYGVYLWELSGNAPTTAVDQSNTGNCASCNNKSTGNITTTYADEFVLSLAEATINPAVPPSSWTDLGGGTWVYDGVNTPDQNTSSGGTEISLHVATQLVSSTGTYSNSMTANGVTANGLFVGIVSIKVGAAAHAIKHKAQVI